MKTIINKVLHWLSLSIISVVLLLAILLGLFKLAAPHLEAHHHDLEQLVSELVKQPICISKVTVSNRGLEPVLTFHDITIFNEAKTKALLQVRELQIGIDLIGSLLKWSIKPGLLVVCGIELSIYQDKNGDLYASGIKGTLTNSAVNADFAFNKILEWLFEQGQIDLTDMVLTWRLADSKILKFTDLRLRLNNGILQHNLKVDGKYVQKHLPAKFNAELKLRGDILKQAISSLTGDVVVEDWSSELPQQFGMGSFSLPQSGDVNLIIKHSQAISSLFRQPILLNYLESEVTWQNSKDGLSVRAGKLKYKDNWLALRGSLQFIFPSVVDPVIYDQSKRHNVATKGGDKSPAPIVDVQLEFKLLNLAKAKLYYPVTVLPPDATAWLDQAFISSKPMTGTMILQGPVDKFPFDNNEGRFLVDADIRDVHLDYNDGWPPLDNINGKIIFANRSMTILARSAKIMHEPVESIKAIIPDLDVPILYIDGAINADSGVGLKFLNSSPLKKSIAGKLQTMNITGLMRLVLKMVIPLSPLAQQKNTQVDGNITLHNNYLRPYGFNFGVDNIQGELHFTENDLTGNKLQGSLFGKPVNLAVKTLDANNNDTVTQVDMQGEVDIKNLEQAFSTTLDPYLRGDFKYHALLELHSITQESVFKLNSNLQGIAVDLPEPFAKKLIDNSKFYLACYFGGNKLPHIVINYNDQINAALIIKQRGVKPWQVMAGEIRFGATKAEVSAASGIVISGNINKLDWSVWRNYLSRTGNNLAKTSAAIRLVSLSISELRVLAQVLKQVVLRAQPKNNGWDIMLAAPTIQGEIFVPTDGTGAQIKGVFQKFYLDQQNENMATLKPQDLPPLNFIANDFHYGKQVFNKLEFITEQKASGLKINKINIDGTKFNLTANGDWWGIGSKQQSVLRGRISSDDIGGLLKQWDLTDNLIGSKGEAIFALKWQGAPYKPTLRAVSGSFAVSAYNGRIINFSGKTETALGFGKVLNMLSLRNLSLDFGGWIKQGFGFDKMIGNFELINGIAFARNINLDGSIARVRAYGRIGLVMQDYDLNLSTTPHVTSSVPVAATFLGGPVIGLLSWFAADAIIAPALKKATTYTYHITGSWDNPIVKKI